VVVRHHYVRDAAASELSQIALHGRGFQQRCATVNQQQSGGAHNGPHRDIEKRQARPVYPDGYFLPLVVHTLTL